MNVMTTNNYFAQGRRTLLSSPSTALEIPRSKQRRAANRPVQIGESRLGHEMHAREAGFQGRMLRLRSLTIR